jgi:hypothetical protein
MYRAGIWDGKWTGKDGKTGIWGKKRENGTGFGANFPFSRPLPVFLQTSVWCRPICGVVLCYRLVAYHANFIWILVSAAPAVLGLIGIAMLPAQ